MTNRRGVTRSTVLLIIFGAAVAVVAGSLMLRSNPEARDDAHMIRQKAMEEAARNPIMPPSATRAIEPVPTH